MDPITLALATFGVQKLRGKSTRTALKDAFTVGGLGSLAGAAGVQGFGTFGQGLQTYGAKLGLSQAPGVAQSAVSDGVLTAGMDTGIQALPVTSEAEILKTMTPGTYQAPPPSFFEKIVGTPTVKDKAGNIIKEGTGFKGLSTPTKLVLGTTGASLVSSALADDEEEQPPFTEEDYKKAYAEQRSKTGPFERATYSQVASAPSLYDYSGGSMYRLKEGGIVSALPKFNAGGINYLPSKQTHDENDVNNYVRAQGYVEDGTGNGNKDEDTMLAQLADGEFVSRADAILGAGIMEGANPQNMKDMRKKGAAFFYDQQAKFKRVYDLLNASRKVN